MVAAPLCVVYCRDGNKVGASFSSTWDVEPPAAAVVSGSSTGDILSMLEQIRQASPTTFTIVHSDHISSSARARLNCFASGARMLAHDDAAVAQGLDTTSLPNLSGRLYCCPACGLDGLSEHALHLHFPLYHSTEIQPLTIVLSATARLRITWPLLFTSITTMGQSRSGSRPFRPSPRSRG